MTRCLWWLAVVLLSLSPVGARAGEAGRASGEVVRSLDGDGWRIATDPRNEGREAKWYGAPLKDAKPTKVPWVIQDVFPAYHGVAWYWKEFEAPANPHAGGRYQLRFWAVDYLAEVWLNGTPVGRHEGGESPFVFDVTDAIHAGGRNLLAVRVLNPTHEPIDGIVLNETAHRNKVIPYVVGSTYDHGGIVDSVEVLAVPSVSLGDLVARPETATGKIRVQVQVSNAGRSGTAARLEWTVAPAAGGETLQRLVLDRKLAPGDTVVEAELRLAAPRRWELNDPFLYRVTVRVGEAESSVRCGFRDFAFENGCFRLNGRRLFLRCSHTGNACPVGFQVPHDPDVLRRDLLNVKVMGFNAIRFISGVAVRSQLDLCDEIGLMVYEETFASWRMSDSPRMPQRYDESVLGMIRRDRNHPSIVMWGLLNETGDGPVFRHAAAALPKVRALDDTRVVMLSSGRWDQHPRWSEWKKGVVPPPMPANLGSLSNPGTAVWQDVLVDQHSYPHAPYKAEAIQKLRTSDRPLFLSENGIGSAVDLCRVARHYEQLGATHAEDAQFYRDKLDKFLADWERWKLAEVFARPEDFFGASLRRMAGQRLNVLNAIRANPLMVGYSLTGTVDQGMSGEGLFTTFRELKPGTVDAMFDALARLRLCLFAEPVNVYGGTKVRLEAVLANEDALAPGEYPVRLRLVGPRNQCLFEKVVKVAIGREAPFAQPVFAEEVAVNGPSGRYRFLASFDRGGAATGGETEFHLSDPAEMPAVKSVVTLAGDDAELVSWLDSHGIRHRKLAAGAPESNEVILVSKTPPAFEELWRRVEHGATAVFLSPSVLKKGDQRLGWLPLKEKGTISNLKIWGGLYLKDEWTRVHPIFEGLPCGGLMDPTFYREIIPKDTLVDQAPPSEAVAGAIMASADYASGLMVAVHKWGAGRFILNTLLIRENLGTNPVAERLLRNLLNYAAPRKSVSD